MFEIGERSEARMSYDEAMMYCFALGDGWRLPTRVEYVFNGGCGRLNVSWRLNDPARHHKTTWYTTPVRDLKDD